METLEIFHCRFYVHSADKQERLTVLFMHVCDPGYGLKISQEMFRLLRLETRPRKCVGLVLQTANVKMLEIINIVNGAKNVLVDSVLPPHAVLRPPQRRSPRRKKGVVLLNLSRTGKTPILVRFSPANKLWQRTQLEECIFVNAEKSTCSTFPTKNCGKMLHVLQPVNTTTFTCATIMHCTTVNKSGF